MTNETMMRVAMESGEEHRVLLGSSDGVAGVVSSSSMLEVWVEVGVASENEVQATPVPDLPVPVGYENPESIAAWIAAMPAVAAVSIEGRPPATESGCVEAPYAGIKETNSVVE